MMASRNKSSDLLSDALHVIKKKLDLISQTLTSLSVLKIVQVMMLSSSGSGFVM